MRVSQPIGARGSLKWIQLAVNEDRALLDPLILAGLRNAAVIEWLSPLREDEFAEYRDGSFLKLIGLSDLAPALAAFWPARGPQWDALGRTGTGEVLIVEAKAHVAEVCSPGSQASGASREKIETALEQVRLALDAKPLAPWSGAFYQFANRIAHLWFLRRNGVDAHLILVDFVGDEEMGGPKTPEAWDAAYVVANYVLGLRKQHALSRFIHHVTPDVSSR